VRRWKVGTEAKGWLAGPWDGSAPVAVGYANVAADEPHAHRETTELFLVARGTVTVRSASGTEVVGAGEVIAFEPGEAHTFVDASPDYFAFVVHAGGDGADRVEIDGPSLGADA
jgi:mannose-6-phosphate isomerase-like protein (cupin superfamily)